MLERLLAVLPGPLLGKITKDWQESRTRDGAPDFAIFEIDEFGEAVVAGAREILDGVLIVDREGGGEVVKLPALFYTGGPGTARCPISAGEDVGAVDFRVVLGGAPLGKRSGWRGGAAAREEFNCWKDLESR